MNPKISIIIPIYNVAEYLERCLISVQNQTFGDFEAICINDGSTDNSLRILKKFASQDERFKVFDKKNEGISQTRNFGVDHSSGVYVLFVDSDDWISEKMLEELYTNAITENADIVMCGYSREYGDKSLVKNFSSVFEEQKEIFTKKQVQNFLQRKVVGPIGTEVNQPEHLDSLATVWAKLYSKKIIESIYFVNLKKVGTAEDALYNVMVFHNAQKVVWIGKPMYHYWKGNEESLTSNCKADLYEKWCNLFNYMHDFIKTNTYSEDFEVALQNRIWLSTLGLAMNEFVFANNPNNFFKKMKRYKQIVSSDVIQNAFDFYDAKDLSLHWRFFYNSVKRKNVVIVYLLVQIIEIMRKVK